MHRFRTLALLATSIGVRIAASCCALLAVGPTTTFAEDPQPDATCSVGIRQVEYIDAHHGGRKTRSPSAMSVPFHPPTLFARRLVSVEPRDLFLTDIPWICDRRT